MRIDGGEKTLHLFGRYLYLHRFGIATYLGSCVVFVLLFFLYHLPLAAVGYATLLSGLLCLVLLVYSWICFLQKHRRLEQLQQELHVTLEHLPAPTAPFEEEYQALLRLGFAQSKKQEQEWQICSSDRIDYYTAWVHQIKTPIAAMRLHLQAGDSLQNRGMLEDLQRIEQYVEMVLCYLRLDSDSTDYLFAEYDLDDIVRQAVRRFSFQFITRKIRLIYVPLQCRVLTDEKWLLFVIEQVLSNALKYTPSGGTVTITLESPDILCIQDTGIGIEPEDLPRVFEKGYTGYNGRLDKKASGIGLYLCRRICTNLHHTITAESQPDAGTTIRLNLHREQHRVE